MKLNKTFSVVAALLVAGLGLVWPAWAKDPTSCGVTAARATYDRVTFTAPTGMKLCLTPIPLHRPLVVTWEPRGDQLLLGNTPVARQGKTGSLALRPLMRACRGAFRPSLS